MQRLNRKKMSEREISDGEISDGEINGKKLHSKDMLKEGAQNRETHDKDVHDTQLSDRDQHRKGRNKAMTPDGATNAPESKEHGIQDEEDVGGKSADRIQPNGPSNEKLVGVDREGAKLADTKKARDDDTVSLSSEPSFGSDEEGRGSQRPRPRQGARVIVEEEGSPPEDKRPNVAPDEDAYEQTEAGRKEAVQQNNTSSPLNFIASQGSGDRAANESSSKKANTSQLEISDTSGGGVPAIYQDGSIRDRYDSTATREKGPAQGKQAEETLKAEVKNRDAGADSAAERIDEERTVPGQAWENDVAKEPLAPLRAIFDQIDPAHNTNEQKERAKPNDEPAEGYGHQPSLAEDAQTAADKISLGGTLQGRLGGQGAVSTGNTPAQSTGALTANREASNPEQLTKLLGSFGGANSVNTLGGEMNTPSLDVVNPSDALQVVETPEPEAAFGMMESALATMQADGVEAGVIDLESAQAKLQAENAKMSTEKLTGLRAKKISLGVLMKFVSLPELILTD
mmetsp:Transcript_6634/g.20087  ORF Transcript_6634/g.20087 Transcript_6634/m.20087 type:complete len:513 (+) Transcript_6634:184-1722(+)